MRTECNVHMIGQRPIEAVQFWDRKPSVEKLRARNRAAEAIRIIIREAMRCRRELTVFPKPHPNYFRAKSQFDALVWAAKIAARYALP